MGAGASALMNEESNQFDNEKIEAMARLKFDEYDHDKNNFLENAELYKVAEWVLASFGEGSTTIEHAKLKMVERIDANKDGKLDFQEFIELFKLMTARYAMIDRAKAKFTELDTDSSGFLEGTEIDQVVTYAMKDYDGQDPTQYREVLMAKVDSNNDGKIDVDEFVILFEDLLDKLEISKANAAATAASTADSTPATTEEGLTVDKIVEPAVVETAEVVAPAE